ncbi:hypothetical protein AVEN_197278-1 [Araneus ventricosus]|uniref:Uncharacterized protein n=1 Tax=Araneus ventricosus TaxID=182803 RepID=A0A4Y2TGV4_ARAVE|nr:hypothetical protein AVEN_197278-1 [Araneus ventricosus]
MELLISNRGQMMGPEPEPLSKLLASRQMEGVWFPTYRFTCKGPTYTANLRWNRGFEPGAHQSCGRDLNTRPPRPALRSRDKFWKQEFTPESFF